MVCPQVVKGMLVQQGMMVEWKKWAAKHECEAVKEGVWLEPTQAIEGRPTKRGWTITEM